jgi:hypothetical protein
VKINYSAEKRRRELALKQKKEDKAKRLADRKALKNLQGDGENPDQLQDEPETDGDEPADETL